MKAQTKIYRVVRMEINDDDNPGYTKKVWAVVSEIEGVVATFSDKASAKDYADTIQARG